MIASISFSYDRRFGLEDQDVEYVAAQIFEEIRSDAVRKLMVKMPRGIRVFTTDQRGISSEVGKLMGDMGDE